MDDIPKEFIELSSDRRKSPGMYLKKRQSEKESAEFL